MPNGWKKRAEGVTKKERMGGSSKRRKRQGHQVDGGYFGSCPCWKCTILRRQKYGRSPKKIKSNKPDRKILQKSPVGDFRKIRGKVPVDKILIDKVKPTKKSVDQKECFICVDTCSTDNFFKTSCGHDMCGDCYDTLKPRYNTFIMGWEEDGYDKILSTKSNCPFCRTPMFGNNVYTENQQFRIDMHNI